MGGISADGPMGVGRIPNEENSDDETDEEDGASARGKGKNRSSAQKQDDLQEEIALEASSKTHPCTNLP